MEVKNIKTKSEENFYLTQTPVKKLLLKFAIPCVLAMLVSALYNIVDQIFLGNSIAGQDGIMATTVVFPFTVLALALALLIGDGCAALYSISLGAKDKKIAKKSIGNSLIVTLILGILLIIIGFTAIDPILKLLGVSGYSETTQIFTKQYMIIILAGIPFYIFSSAMASIIRSDGSPKYSMLSTILGAIINIILDPILIFVCKMGVQGAAIATIIGQVVSAIFCGIYFRKMKLITLSKDSFKLNIKIIGKIIRLGISSFITQIAIAIITIVANNVVGKIGGVNATDAGAALGIVFKVFAIVIAFAIGIAVGAQPIIGYNYGAKKYDRVIKFILSFKIYLGGILFCCLQKASCILLQSINKPYKALFLSLMRDVILLVPGVCLLGLLGNLKLMLWAGILADVGAFIPTIILVLIEIKKLKVQEVKINKQVTTLIANNHYVITIGREFGSGGKFIGQEIAKHFNIKCYDNELITKVSEDFNIDLELLKSVDEKQKSSFWYGFANNYVFSREKEQILPISREDGLFLKQSKTIENLYKNENCVIIGRCADFILKDKPNVIKIFVYSSNLQFKIDRKMEFENCSEEQAKDKINKIDKERADYYNHFTSQTWGDKSNYDLCIDTSVLGIEQTIKIIEDYVKNFLKLKKLK